MSVPRFVELKCKTHYSFLSGASSASELFETAAQLKLSALAITDRNGVYAIPKAYQASKEFGIRLITGAELTIEGHSSITLLTQNRDAYAVLCRILTKLHLDHPKGEGRLSLDEFYGFMNEPRASGLVALLDDKADWARAIESLRDRAYLSYSKKLDGHDAIRGRRSLELMQRYGMRRFATNEPVMHSRARKPVHDVLVSIREGAPVQSAGFRHLQNAESVLKSPEEMCMLYRHEPDALQTAIDIAERCLFSPSELKYQYPNEFIPKGHTAQSYLELRVQEGIQDRYPSGLPADVRMQIDHELCVIRELGFADYFLTIDEIVRFARSRDILCQGRGSAANSAVCYVLGITAVDPVRMKLLFERFISAERGEPPDIDIDFEHERREEVIQYVYQKYGRHRAAMVSAVITYQGRSAFREVAKALGVEVGTLSARKVKQHFGQLKGSENAETRKQIERICDEIDGFPRHLSIHSGGFTLSHEPLNELVPIENAAMPGRTIIQWDKYDLDILGLLKVDLLSLGMLSALKKTLVLTGRKLHEIPPDDPATYDMICKADTIGTFQIESRAQMSMLPRLKPRTYYDLVIEVALVRPGPIVGNMVHPYLKRRRGQEAIDIPHPKLEPILRRTLGVPIFQEQVMAMAIALAGFTPGEADQLRREMGNWGRKGQIETLGRKLRDGLLASQIPISFADRIFEQIKGFAEYGFPESHAASFALLAYASCYLKRHHPAEFAISLINSQPMGFYAAHTLIDDAKRHGVRVLPLDINASKWDLEIEGENTIRLGFRLLRRFSEKDFAALATERTKRPFESLSDLFRRTSLSRAHLSEMAMADAFATLKMGRREALWQILEHTTLRESRANPQLSLFSASEVHHTQTHHSETRFRPLDSLDEVALDYRSLGLSHRAHPMQEIRARVPKLPRLRASEVKQKPNEARITVAGLTVVVQRPPTAKGTVFATLEDETGFIDLLIPKKVFERTRDVILGSLLVVVSGTLKRDGDAATLFVTGVKPYEKTPSEIFRQFDTELRAFR